MHLQGAQMKMGKMYPVYVNILVNEMYFHSRIKWLVTEKNSLFLKNNKDL